MIINHNASLPQPEKGYGAVWGRNQQKQNKRYIIFGVLTVIYMLTILALFFQSTVTSWLPWDDNGALFGFLNIIAWGFPIVGLLGGFQEIFSYNDEVYATDVWHGRNLYAKTVFKEWFTARYGIKITDNEAVALMDGHGIHTIREDNFGRSELVRVRFDYNETFGNFSIVGAHPNSEYVTQSNWEIGDVNEIDFRLLVTEEPTKARTYEWS